MNSYQAFGLMDQDRDGTISMDDLKEVYNSLGKNIYKKEHNKKKKIK